MAGEVDTKTFAIASIRQEEDIENTLDEAYVKATNKGKSESACDAVRKDTAIRRFSRTMSSLAHYMDDMHKGTNDVVKDKAKEIDHRILVDKKADSKEEIDTKMTAAETLCGIWVRRVRNFEYLIMIHDMDVLDQIEKDDKLAEYVDGLDFAGVVSSASTEEKEIVFRYAHMLCAYARQAKGLSVKDVKNIDKVYEVGGITMTAVSDSEED